METVFFLICGAGKEIFLSLLHLPSFACHFSASSIFASDDVPVAILRETADGVKQMSTLSRFLRSALMSSPLYTVATK